MNKSKENLTIITGACGQLGSELSRSYAEQGHTVCVTDIDEDGCKDLTKELKKISDRNHLFLSVDVTSENSVSKLINYIETNNMSANILINNAGTAIFSDFSERTKEEFMRVTEVNLFGTFNCINQLSKHMINNDIEGSIVNIGSIYGVVSSDPKIYTDCARKNSEVYSASKAGVIQMTKYFAVHLSGNHIRVNCVSPGGIFNNQGKDFVKNYSEKTPNRRMAQPQEIVKAIIYLSDNSNSAYVNGQNLLVDGGLTSW